MLEAEAEKSGCSLAEEIRRRLHASLIIHAENMYFSGQPAHD